MILPSNELEKVFNANKKLIDKAYEDTNNKYGIDQATGALYHYFIDFDCSYITNSHGSRTNLKKFVNCYYQNQQILFDYAISSFMINEMKDNLTLEEINMYARDDDGKLNYNPQLITKVVALSLAAWGPYWANHLIACNERAKHALVKGFIAERYVHGKARELDNSRKAMLVNLNGNRKMLSISALNNDIMNMINQDENEKLFDPNDSTLDNNVSYGSR